MQRKIKLTRWFVYEWVKPPRQKPYWVILRSPLPRIHYYHNKRLQVKESQYLIPTYSWTFTSIHNWTYSIMTISPFQCTAHCIWLTNWCTDPSTWLTTNLRRMLVAKFFNLSTQWRSWNSLVTEHYGIQTQQLLQEKDELGQLCLRSQYTCNNNCNNPMTALKIIPIYV